MGEEAQARADRRFEEALERGGASDPRDRYRSLLRELKQSDEERYRKTVARWKAEVIEPLSRDEGDPLACWLAFGVVLAGELHPGRTMVVDGTGRASPLESTPSGSELILHLPEERRIRAIPINLPLEPTAAQRATVDLLVEGRVKDPDR